MALLGILVAAVVLFAGGASSAQTATIAVLGDQAIEPHVDSNPAGSAEAFVSTATASGQLARLSVYLDAGSSAPQVIAGVYADAAGHPGTLLTQGTIDTPVVGAWNGISVPGVAITSGTRYWIALLAPTGTVKFRDRCCNNGTASEASSQTTLATLPAAWTTGGIYRDGPLSAYGSTSDAPPVLTVTPASLALNGVAGTRLPVTKQIGISNSGGGTLSWTVSTTTSWLSASPTSGTDAGNVDITALVQGLAAGTYTGSVTVTAAGTSGSPADVPVTLTLTTDSSPPTITITAPTAGFSVSGTTSVAASAFDDTGVTAVQFAMDGQTLGNPVTSSPYVVSWDTTMASNGSHTLTATARDAAGNTKTSAPVAVTVANSIAAGTLLVGDNVIEPKADSNTAGIIEAFQYTALTSGTPSRLAIYLDTGSTATSVKVGVYSDSGGHPGTLLASGSIASPAAGTWNQADTSGTGGISSGSRYWIAVLGNGGTVRYRDRCCGAGTGSETAAGSTATTLMTTWTTGAVYHDGPMSAYVSSGSGASLPPSLAVSPTSLSFTASAGGTNPAPAPLSVSNVGGGSLSFTAVTDVPWLSASPTAGSAPQTLQVSALASSLAQGSYTGHVTVTANGAQGSPTVISVSLMVTPPAPPPPAGSASDWPMVDHDPARTGDATGETAITSTAARTLTQRWAARLDGKVTAQPLYVNGIMIGGQSTQVVVAATAANSIYALDAVSGTTLWRTNFGPQSGNCAIPGGFGVTGAPAIDRATGRVFAVANDGELHSLSLTTGADVSPPLQLISAPATNKVWGGLNLVNSTLYVADASDGCDTPPWTGQIFKVSVSGAAPVVTSTFTVVPSLSGTSKGGGIWGYGGVSVDSATGRVYAAPGADGNETYTPNADRMLALDGNLNLLGSYEPFHPGNYPCPGAPCDVDFGATPVVFQPSGCPTLVAAGNKNGNLYVMRASDLAAGGNPLQTLTLNTANDWLGNGGIGGVPAYWPEGRMLFVTDAGAGVPGVEAGIVGLAIQPDCTLAVAWSAHLGGNSDPNSTPTVANGVVYVGEGNDGRVFAFDAANGTPLWNSGSQAAGSTFAAPTVAAGTLYVGSWDGQGAADAGTIRAFAPGGSGSTTLLGNQSVESQVDSDPNGVAEAFQATASTSGTLSSLTIYLDGASTASKITAGLYSASGAHPGTLIAKGSLTSPSAGSWNSVAMTTTPITAGTTYWIALLSTGSGTIRFTDRHAGPCKAETSSQTGLTDLPATWASGSIYTDCPLSGYGSAVG